MYFLIFIYVCLWVIGLASPFEQQISEPSAQKIGGRYQTARMTWLDAKGTISPSMEGAGRGLCLELDNQWVKMIMMWAIPSCIHFSVPIQSTFIFFSATGFTLKLPRLSTIQQFKYHPVLIPLLIYEQNPHVSILSLGYKLQNSTTIDSLDLSVSGY